MWRFQAGFEARDLFRDHVAEIKAAKLNLNFLLLDLVYLSFSSSDVIHSLQRLNHQNTCSTHSPHITSSSQTYDASLGRAQCETKVYAIVQPNSIT
jgi:hypothetical protein